MTEENGYPGKATELATH